MGGMVTAERSFLDFVVEFNKKFTLKTLCPQMLLGIGLVMLRVTFGLDNRDQF